VNGLITKTTIFILLASGISVLFFAGAIDNYFAYDDFRFIENNYQGIKQILLGYNTLRLFSNALWAPLFYLFGFNPIGYNLFNIGLYALNAILLFQFIRTLTNDRTLAFFTGIFFVASSVGADVVLWKCANNSMLSLCFYLLTLIAYLRFRENKNSRNILLSLAFYCVAMLSKEEAASLPAIILLLEILFPSGERWKAIALRVLPFCLIIMSYLLIDKIVFHWLVADPSALTPLFKIRPIYSVFGGFSSFFLSPSGVWQPNNVLTYFSVMAIVLAMIFTKNRKLLIFAFCWIIITFLPQSLTSLGQFEPKFMPNSISRYLYIVSIGPAMVYATLLSCAKEKLNRNAFVCMSVAILAIYGWINFNRVQERGLQWRIETAPVAIFLAELSKLVQTFPPNSFIYVDNPPTGRATVQQAMRGFFRNPSITWIIDPYQYKPKAGQRAFIIVVYWQDKTKINGIQIFEPWPANVGR